MAGTTVRSRRLYGPVHATTGGATLVYTVPAGRTAVVRSMVLVNLGTVTSEGRVFLVNGPVANGRVYNVNLDAKEAVFVQDLVFNPGDEVRITSNTTGGGPIGFALYGSLLDGEPE